LQDEQEDLINQDGHDDEDETQIVVHGYGRRKENDQSDDQDSQIELLDLEVVLVISLAQDVILDSFEDS
jgi:hypothetical protein